MPAPVGHLGWRQAHTGTAVAEPPPRARPRDLGPRTQDSGRPVGGLVARLTYLLIALYALTFGYLSVQEHEAFSTHAFDLGNMDQAIWNTYHGRWFEFTNMPGLTTRLAAHVEPILLLVAPLYGLATDPRLLLVLQTLVIALGGLPAFWLARHELKSSLAGLVFAGAYLLAPALEVANLSDFHAVAFSSALLLYALYFLRRDRYLPFFLFAVLAMSTKEQVPLIVLLMGIYLVLVRGAWGWGLATAGTALVWFLLAVGVVIPHFNPTGASPYLSRYDHLGGGVREILINFLSRPQEMVAHVLEPAKLDYLRSLLAPVSYLSLLSPIFFVFALPDFAINLLSGYADMFTGKAHYGSTLVPLVIASAIVGARNLARLAAWLHPRLFAPMVLLVTLAVLAASLTSYVRDVYLPLSDRLPEVTAHHRLAQEVMALIPRDASLVTSSTLNPHLSQRRQISLFPDVRDAEYAFLDVTSTPYPIDVPEVRWRVRVMLEERKEWAVVAARDGYLLLRRDKTPAARRDIPDAFYSFARAPNPLAPLPAREGGSGASPLPAEGGARGQGQSPLPLGESLPADRRGQGEGKSTPKPTYPHDVLFGPTLRFLGFDLQPGPTLHGRDPAARLALYFRVEEPPPEDYRITLFLLDGSGRVVADYSDHPATAWYPTSRWRKGEVVRVEAPAVGLAGARRVEVQLGVTSGQRLDLPDRRLRPRPLGASRSCAGQTEPSRAAGSGSGTPGSAGVPPAAGVPPSPSGRGQGEGTGAEGSCLNGDGTLLRLTTLRAE